MHTASCFAKSVHMVSENDVSEQETAYRSRSEGKIYRSSVSEKCEISDKCASF